MGDVVGAVEVADRGAEGGEGAYFCGGEESVVDKRDFLGGGTRMVGSVRSGWLKGLFFVFL